MFILLVWPTRVRVVSYSPAKRWACTPWLWSQRIRRSIWFWGVPALMMTIICNSPWRHRDGCIRWKAPGDLPQKWASSNPPHKMQSHPFARFSFAVDVRAYFHKITIPRFDFLVNAAPWPPPGQQLPSSGSKLLPHHWHGSAPPSPGEARPLPGQHGKRKCGCPAGARCVNLQKIEQTNAVKSKHMI